MRKAITNFFPISHRLSQYKDILLLSNHQDKRLYRAKKEVLWYRGHDIYKHAFRSAMSKLNKQEPVFSDASEHFTNWLALSNEAKAIALYLGFHTSSTNNNARIVALIQGYRQELELYFDFRYDEFQITAIGRSLLSSLLYANLTFSNEDNVTTWSKLQLHGKAKRTQKESMVESKIVFFSGNKGSGAASVSLYQCMQNKQAKQGIFVIQSHYSSDTAVSVNQHAFNHLKQYDFYMDSPANLRENFHDVATHICNTGGYYYGNAIKNYLGRLDDAGENYLLNLITHIADTVENLNLSALAPVIYIDLGSIQNVLINQEFSIQLERLCQSDAKVCITEAEYIYQSHYYDLLIKKFDAIHFIGRQDHDNLADSMKVRMDLGYRQLNEHEFYAKNTKGMMCGGSPLRLDFELLSFQVKGRFIRLF